MLGDVRSRPARLPADGEFLLSVYAATRRPELSVLGWSEEQVDAFIQTQYDAQTRHYRNVHPRASHSVVTVAGEPAGRLIVERSDEEIRIVDIALLPQFRRAGVGGELVRRLLEEADAGGLPVRCHVVQDNDARVFWERMGLAAQGVDGMHVAMERGCATSPR
jgi:ribosomal protein S18 acetylase RimI-like enzyme